MTSNPHAALGRLRAGNERYVHGSVGTPPTPGHVEPASPQAPFAAVLGCSDSRVTPEVVFDQGAGDLFVVRVAGHVVTPATAGSLEFAVDRLGVRLVVVLGHSDCGAVRATIDGAGEPSAAMPSALATVVDQVRPAVERTLGASETAEPSPGAWTKQVQAAVSEHVRLSVAALSRESRIFADLNDRGELHTLGAVYDLETGVVAFLDEDPG